MSDKLLKESDVMRIAFQLPYVVNSAFFDAVKALPSVDRLQGEWIPCSERLPVNDDWVIISVLDETGDTPYRYSDFGWYLEAAKCWIVESEQRTDVIAWMPLPKPWRSRR